MAERQGLVAEVREVRGYDLLPTGTWVLCSDGIWRDVWSDASNDVLVMKYDNDTGAVRYWNFDPETGSATPKQIQDGRV